MRWGWWIFSLYLTAIKLPGTCTMSVLLSFRRLYTRIMPSRLWSRNRDSSLNQSLRQFWNVQHLDLLHQRTLSRLFHGVNTALKYRLLGLIPSCRSRLRTVCELIFRNSGIPAAVVDAATVRFRRWKTRMYRSCPGVAMRGLPLLWRSFVEPVCWNLFHILEMVLWLTFRVRATSFWNSPAWRRPIAIFRVAGSYLGIAAYQLSNTSKVLNLVL